MRKLNTLSIEKEDHLCKLIGSSHDELVKICNQLETNYKIYYNEWDVQKSNGKFRTINATKGRLKDLQLQIAKLLCRVVLPPSLHGGVKNMSIVTNARVHAKKDLVICFDIKSHFPNVSNRQVYNMFFDMLKCSPDVSRILTRLTTLNYGLPQGSPSSTVVSNLVVTPLAKRLEDFTKSRNSTGTIFVDDITVAGDKRLVNQINKVVAIVRQAGFKINPAKTKIQFSNQEQIITGIAIKNGRLVVPENKYKEYVNNIEKLKPKYSEEALARIKGQINFVRQVNVKQADRLDEILKKQMYKLKSHRGSA